MLVLVSDNNDQAASGHGDIGVVLLELQAIDTAHDQSVHRRDTLTERVDHAEAVDRMRNWESQRVTTIGMIGEAEAGIAECEEASAEIDSHRKRLEAQLKTVIAPREAEALQHEIATLAERRSDLDDRELELMSVHSDAESRLNELLAIEGALRAEVAGADERLATAESIIRSELESLAARRELLLPSIPPALAKRYEAVRSKLGVAAARLAGSRCEGCHLDLSAGELDEVRRTPDDRIPDCPQCGRMLIR
jgi:predicted  nucleic acid-binding Zn-ribbon protein